MCCVCVHKFIHGNQNIERRCRVNNVWKPKKWIIAFIPFSWASSTRNATRIVQFFIRIDFFNSCCVHTNLPFYMHLNGFQLGQMLTMNAIHSESTAVWYFPCYFLKFKLTLSRTPLIHLSIFRARINRLIKWFPEAFWATICARSIVILFSILKQHKHTIASLM